MVMHVRKDTKHNSGFSPYTASRQIMLHTHFVSCLSPPWNEAGVYLGSSESRSFLGRRFQEAQVGSGETQGEGRTATKVTFVGKSSCG